MIPCIYMYIDCKIKGDLPLLPPYKAQNRIAQGDFPPACELEPSSLVHFRLETNTHADT